MLKIYLTILMFLMFMISTSAQTTTVAVNELTGIDLTIGELTTLSSRFRSELIKTGSFTVMERSEMNSILKEQGFQQSGACDEASCMVEVGRLLGVQKIIAGSVGKIGSDFFTVSLRMIDVTTGKIDKSADYDFTGQLSGLLTTGLAQASAILAVKTSYTAPKPTIQDKPVLPKETNTKQKSAITITTIPSGASITLDTLIGTTPFTTYLKIGSYPLSLSLAGYKKVNKRIYITSNKPFNETFTFTTKNVKKSQN